MMELLLGLLDDGKEGEDEELRNAKTILSAIAAIVIFGVIVGIFLFMG